MRRRRSVPTRRPSRSVPPAPPASFPAPAPVSGVQVPAPAGVPAENGILHAVKMSIEPKEEGKVKIGFYGPGHQKPDVSKTLRSDKVAEFAAQLASATGNPYTEAHLRTPNSYEVNIKVAWKLGAPTGYGTTRYKDILGIDPA